MRKYLVYLLRWQISGIVMMPILMFTKSLGTVIGVIIAQLIGAIIFWFVDKRIFK
jgi:hypothetical protein